MDLPLAKAPSPLFILGERAPQEGHWEPPSASTRETTLSQKQENPTSRIPRIRTPHIARFFNFLIAPILQSPWAIFFPINKIHILVIHVFRSQLKMLAQAGSLYVGQKTEIYSLGSFSIIILPNLEHSFSLFFPLLTVFHPISLYIFWPILSLIQIPAFRRQQYNPSNSQHGRMALVEPAGLKQVAEDTKSFRKLSSTGSFRRSRRRIWCSQKTWLFLVHLALARISSPLRRNARIGNA